MVRKSVATEFVRLLVDTTQLVGEQPQWLRDLLALVENQLTSGSGVSALEVVRERPTDKRRQQVLVDEVGRCLHRDAAFAQELQEALRETKPQRKSFHADARRLVRANVDGDLNGTLEIPTVVGDGVAASGGSRVKVDRSRRRKISIWGIGGITIAGGVTSTLLLLPGSVGVDKSDGAPGHGSSPTPGATNQPTNTSGDPRPTTGGQFRRPGPDPGPGLAGGATRFAVGAGAK